MATLYVEFRRIRGNRTSLETLNWWQKQDIERAQLAAGEEWFDRLVERLRGLIERDLHFEVAVKPYETSPVAQARKRRVKILIKRGDIVDTKILLQGMRRHCAIWRRM